MKMTDRKARRILLSLLLCGCFASTAHAAETTLYESSDGRVTVTANEAEKTVTYKDAEGNEKTYSYTTIDTGSINIAVTGLEYESPNAGTTEKKYYAWTEDGFSEVDASAAQVTVSYVTDNPYGDGILNDGTTGYDGQDISGDFVNDSMHGGSSSYGGAIDNYAGSENASLGTIKGNFIGNNEVIVGTSEGSGPHQHAHGGAIANYGDSYTASIEAINGNFIGNYAQSTGYFESSTENYGEVSHGGAIYNAGTIGDINGSFIGNWAQSQVSQAYGGAIYNNSSIGNITGNFIGNSVNAEEGGFAWGGAIINQSSSASITGISGYFLGNYAKTGGSYAWGGAIENNGGAIGSIEGTFIGNFAEHSGETTGSAYSGAISTSGTVTTIKGDFIGNHALATERYAQAGAIGTSARITTLTGNFIGNYAASTGSTSGYSYAMGGALYNSGEITELSADFTGNYATSANSYVWGGAVYNSGTITTLTGDFTDNYASTTGSNVRGGAIYNRGTIRSLNANFTGNYASTTGNSYIYGGAINNTGTIIAIEGSFTGNYAQSLNTGVSTRVLGGAIYNESGTIGTITADFTGNHAETLGTFAYGGAIYNESGTIGTIDGNFTGNYALSEGSRSNSYAYGGAIYNTGTITGITGTFASNYAESAANDSYGGAIFNQGTIGDPDGTGTDDTGIYKATFTGNTAARGGAIYNGTEKDGDAADPSAGGYSSIITSISGSSFTGNSASGYGGAIYNYDDGAIYSITDSLFQENFAEGGNGGAIENAEANSYIGTISGNTFEGNYTKASGYGGGAIYNEGTIDSITGNVFKGNEAVSYGGAIYNNGGTIVSMDGGSDGGFEENSAQYGGAIYNTGTIGDIASDFTSNEATAASGSAYGGAIYNTGTIGVITGDFDTNSVESSSGSAYGGAIYNTGTIAGIEASKNGFTGNSATAPTSTNAQGGAIANYASAGGNSLIGATVVNGKITTDTGSYAIDGDFTGNTAGEGGAIYNYATGEGSIAAIGDIKGSFTSNEAYDNTSNSQGGAIHNEARANGYAFIGSITGDFTGNSAVDSSTSGTTPTATGGAIYNTASGSGGTVEIGDITGSFYDNSAVATGIGNARGGAVNNAAGAADTTATIGNITGDFIGNYSQSVSAAAWGGAILNIADSPNAAAEIGDITEKEVGFSGNYATSESGNVLGGAIHNRAGTSVDDPDVKTTVIMGNIAAGFTGNYVTTARGTADGGAISNLLAGANADPERMAVIGTITGDFSDNYATATSAAIGGAISNRGNGGYGTAVIGGTVDSSGAINVNGGIAGNFTGNTATGATAYGGAIANYAQGYVTAQMGYITGDFEENEATATGEALGGAIYNNAANSNNGTATIGAISGDFTGNYATSTSSGNAEGGAIYNAGTIGTISGSTSTGSTSTGSTFTGNYAAGVTEAAGGAIYNTGTITGLTGAFDGNYVTATSGTAQGGAIYNTGSIGADENSENMGYTVAALTGNYAEGTNASGGGIYDTTASSVTITGTVTGNRATATGSDGNAYGGAVYLTDVDSVLTVEGAIGGEYFDESTEETYSGNWVSSTGGNAYGGAIYNAGTLNITSENGVTVSGNYAASESGNAYGGAIYNVGTISELEKVTFSENFAESGGAIYNAGTITGITGGSFTGNYIVNKGTGSSSTARETESGGAIYNAEGATIGFISATYFSGNQVDITDTRGNEYDDVYGAAIANFGTIGAADDGNGNLTGITGSTFENNTVTITKEGSSGTEDIYVQGGAIYNKGTIYAITDSEFNNNTVTATGSGVSGYAEGGAIWNAGTITEIGNVEFTGNTAGNMGGAIRNADSIGSITGSTFTGNRANDASTAGMYGGGAIFNGGSISSIMDSTFTSNTTSARGGAILNEDTGTISTIYGITFKENSAYEGGAIYNGDTIGSITKSIFTGNIASNYGGAIYNDGNEETTYSYGHMGSITDSTFTENSASGGKGGAIYNGYSMGSITGSTFTGNAAENVNNAAYGGAIYNSGTGTIESIEGVSFKDNSATSTESDAAGGALYNAGTITGSISLGELTGNSATSRQGNAYGGAVYDEAENSVITVTGDVTSNYASAAEGEVKGGALYTKEGDALTITGTSEKTLTISGNYVTGAKDAQGGAVYNEGTLTIDEDTVLTGNHAESTAGEAKGGAIYNVGTITGAEALNLGAVTGNYVEGATGAYGGALYDTVTTNVNITGDVTNNYARVTGTGNVQGGVIYLDQAEGVATAITVTGDVAGNHAETAGGYAWGGAFYNNSDGTLTITGTIGGYTDDTKTEYNGNYVTASGEAKGGAVYNEGTLNISEDGPDLIGNYAKSTGDAAYGGAIYNAETGTITGSGTLNLGNITGNYVEGATGAYGGAIYDTVTTAINISGDVTDNHAEVTESGSVQGGVIYLKQAEENPTSITVTGDVAGNWAKTNAGTAEGGAFYNGSAGSLSIAGTIGGYTDETKTEYNGNSVSATADAAGGAIYNAGTLTISEAPDLIGNEATSTQGAAYGGAIYNKGTINNTGTVTEGTITLGDVIGNTATGYSGAQGGAVYDTAYTGVSISGEVTDNHAIVIGEGNVEGGVIYLAKADEGETTITVTGNVTGNSAETASGYAHGGAFYNNNVGILTIGGSLGGKEAGNYVKATGEAYGGAIYNAGTLTVGSDGNPIEVTGNYATSSAGEAAGGAIYNTGTATVTGGSMEGNKASATGETGDALGGAIYNAEGATLNITAGVALTDNAVTSNAGKAMGGAIYNIGDISENGAVQGTLYFGNITGNSATGATGAYGGAVYDTINTDIVIEGNVTDNYAKVTGTGDVRGGVIYLEQAENNPTSITVQAGSTGEGGNVAGNHAETEGGYAWGGAFYNNANGTLSISGTIGAEDDGNYVSATGEAAGGAVYNTGILIINETGPDLIGNYAVSSAGDAAGGAIYNAGTFANAGSTGGVLNLGNITGNYAEGATSAKGGAIYDTVTTTINISGDVTGNHVKVTSAAGSSAEGSVYGGVIYLEKANAGETTITVSGNVAGNYAETENGTAEGGAFYNNQDGTLNISGYIGSYTDESTGTEYEGNHARASGDAAGGAIYNAGNLNISTTNEIKGNYAVSTEGTAAGGAIYNSGSVNGGGTLEVGALTGNYAQGATGAAGGAIYDTVSTDVQINGDVTSNYAKTESGNVYGGVIYLEQAGSTATTVTVEGNVIGNHAETGAGEAKGGAFYNNGNATLTIEGTTTGTSGETKVTISGNYVSAAGTDATTGEGYAAYGGAVYNAGTLVIGTDGAGPDLINNTATSKDGEAAGGAIYNVGNITGSGTLELGTLTGNTATGATGAYGGAVYDTVSTAVNISGDVSENGAEVTGSGDVHGGVIYLGQADGGAATSITVTGNVTENYAKTASGEALGGAFYNNANGTLTINAADSSTLTVSGNYASAAGEGNAAKGGAIYNEGILNITNGVVLSGNTATSSGGEAAGGAIYTTGTVNNGAALYFGGITGNSAIGATGAKGGAIYDAVSTVININGEVSDNHAIVNGEGVTDANVYGGVIYLEQAENQATSITVTGTVTGNSAETSGGKAKGGAFYNNGEATLTIVEDETSIITGNYVKATGRAAGGAIYNAGTLNLGTDPVLMGNYAMSTAGTAMGGAIYNEGTINTLETSSEDGLVLGDLSGNQAVGATGAMGGAIYDKVNTVITINGDVTDNHARVVSKDETLGYEATTAVSGDVMGGVIYLEQADSGAATTITVKGNVAGNSAETENGNAYGGAFYNTDNGTLTITGNIGGYTDSTETEYNGNYVVASGEAKGGAIYNTGTLNINSGDGSGPDLIGNYAESTGGIAMGGAIYNEGTISEDGSLTFGAVTGNQAIGYSGAYGGAIYDTVSTVVNINGNVTDNHAIVQSDNGTAAGNVYGGVIYLAKADSGAETAITVTGTVTGNSAETENGSAYGGAFYNNQTATLTIIDADKNSIISGNYVSAAGTDAVTDENGEAKGGAIYNAGTLNLGSEVVLSGNYAVSADGSAYGGAIYNEGIINTADSTSMDGELVLGSVTGNYAQGATGAYGGAIYDTVDAKITINGSVSGNHAEVTVSGDVEGGVIYLEKANDGATTITVNGDVTNNYATTKDGSAYGGAFYNNAAGTLTIGGDITGNYVSATETAAGGAIYNEGVLNIGGAAGDNGETTYTKITGNSATSTGGAAYGGAIYNAGTINDGTVGESKAEGGTLSLGEISGNFAKGATGAYGGAIYDDVNTEIDIYGNVSNNYAEVTDTGDVKGGVIYLEKADQGEETSISITGSVTGNHAATAGGTAEGGAFYNNEQATLTIGGEISGNYASAAGEKGNAYGGAIYNEGVLNIGGTEADGTTTYTNITNNYAVSEAGEAAGGAIYNTGTIETGDTETLEVGSVTGNYAIGATGAKGGAIYDEVYTSVTIHGDASDNHVQVTGENAKDADVYGGVIYLEKANETETTITVTGNVENNSAETTGGSAYGGAFYNNADGTLTIGGDVIRGNYVSATDNVAGGAIYNEGVLNIGGAVGENGETTYTNITGNSATSTAGAAYGGAIYNAGTINSDGSVEESESSGGTLSLGEVSGNFAKGATGAYGGAIYDDVNTEIDIYGNVSNNYAEVTEKGDVYGGVIYLEKAASGEATAITVTGSVTGNSATTAEGNAYGGAFYNHEQGTLTIGGDISGNSVSATKNAFGGAIYNDGILNIGGEDGDPEISGNSATSAAGVAAGGAIYNTSTGNINDSEELNLGSVTNNYVEGATGAMGGAIYDEVSTAVNITGDVTGNYAKTASGDVQGGVIYLDKAGSEETSISITGTVSGNHAETADGTAEGGAFYNDENATLTIGGDITGNWAEGSEAAMGGAIFNEGTLNVASGIALTGNYAVSSAGEASGGALYNTGSVNGDETMNLTSVSGNYVEGATAAYGGAIYDAGTGADIAVTGDVTGNTATASEGEASGGAIYIGSGSSITIEGDVTGNTATGTAAAKGGAIYNEGTVTLNGTVTGNTASGDDAMGGAIYNAGTVTMNIENQDAEITGNYVEKGGNKEANIVYGTADSTTNLNIKDGSVKLSDSFEGETGYSVNIAGNGTDAATFYLYDNLLKDSSLSMAGITFNTINNSVTAYSVDKFTVAGDFDMVADVDLENESMDRIVTNGNSYGEHKGNLNVAGVNLISDTDKSRVGIYFAEPGLKENVTSSIGALPGSYQQTAYSPINEYSVTYDKNYDGSWGDDGGYFVFNRERSNPSAMIPPLSQVGAFNAMSLMFDYAFEHSDYYMKLPSEVRLAIREKAKAARAEKLAEKNGTTFEEESAKIDEAREEEMASREGIKFYEHDNVLPLYDQHELTRPGAWVKPFSSIESVPFKGDFKARDKYYGVLLGADTDVREGRDGWASVFTGYAGYQGIHQSYEGGVIRQDGGVLGVTESFYKKNFYTAWTAAAASTRADGRTMYGHDKTRLYTYGIASKSGWNLEYDGGKYIVLPTFMASYTYVDLRSYTSAAGLKMDADGMRAVQLNPNVKWIRNMRNGWQPYLTVGEVWTVGQRSAARADGHRLDTLRLRPYTEYGLGAQKRWANEYDGYFQVLGHAGGRRGALFTMGFRWTFN